MQMMRYAGFIFLLLLSCRHPEPFTKQEQKPAFIKIGFACIDITPPRKVPLGGYGARMGRLCKGIHDRIYSKAVVIQTREEKVAIVCNDLIGVSEQIRKDIIKSLPQSTGLKPEKILICSTHTHSGPGGLAKGFLVSFVMGRYDEEFYRWMVKKISSTIIMADKNKVGGRIGFGVDTIAGLNKNRAIKDGPVDREIGVIKFEGLDGKLTGILVNFTAHPTVLGPENLLISADYPGFLQSALEKKYKVPVLFTNGALGDQAPICPQQKRGFEGAKALGEKLANKISQMLPDIKTSDRIYLKMWHGRVPLPLKRPKKLPPKTTLLQILEIDRLALIAIPGEPCVEIGLKLKKRFSEIGVDSTFIIGLSNAYIGYIATRRHFWINSYEARSCYVGPDFSKILIKHCLKIAGVRFAQRMVSALKHLELPYLEKLYRAVSKLKRQKRVMIKHGFKDIKAIFHCHSVISYDSTGTMQDIISSAKKTGVKVIFMNEHLPLSKLDRVAKGMQDGILFIPGVEHKGLLNYPLKDQKKMVFLAHPEGWKKLPEGSATGMEIYNIHSDFLNEYKLAARLLKRKVDFNTWVKIIEASRRYPVETIASIFDNPLGILRKWDRWNQKNRLVGIAGNDAHANVGLSLKLIDRVVEIRDILGKKVAQVKIDQLHPYFRKFVKDAKTGQTFFKALIDPYDVLFSYVSTHILVKEFRKDAIIEAVRNGHCYISFDWLCNPAGFLFSTHDRKAIMGDVRKFRWGTKLVCEVPVLSKIYLICDGRVIFQKRGYKLEYEVKKKGVYRVEVYLDIIGKERLWIYSNPIFIR
jgi:hypothetical protein